MDIKKHFQAQTSAKTGLAVSHTKSNGLNSLIKAGLF
jgi:hypothetical protein